MKYIGRFLVLLVIIGYVVWPYYAVRRFTTAVNGRDFSTVDDMIDWSEFKESMKKMIMDGLMLKAADHAGPNVDRDAMRSQMEKVMATPPMEAKFQELLTSKTMVKAFRTNKQGGTTPMTFRNETWETPWLFTIQDIESESRLIFTFKGLAWKLTGLRVPDDELARFIESQPVR